MLDSIGQKHIGQKIRRFRELKGIKQESLAVELGISRQSVSKIEQSATIDDDLLEKISAIFDVSPETIKNFNEEAAVNIISNAFHDNATLNGLLLNPTFNPIDKVVELYELLLETERSKVKLLEELLKEKGK